MTDPVTVQRLDVWLWHARFFKTRSLATGVCKGGSVRLNGRTGTKPSASVHVGDVVTFPQGPHIRVVEIVGFSERRGPAPEAQTLYSDLAPPQSRAKTLTGKAAQREKGAGRPTKRERRATDRLKPDPGAL